VEGDSRAGMPAKRRPEGPPDPPGVVTDAPYPFQLSRTADAVSTFPGAVKSQDVV